MQAAAAEWALVLLAELRLLLRDSAAELVFFQRDEVLPHCPADLARTVCDAVAAAADTARRHLGDTPVRFPLQARTVASYDER